jgi:PPOX class probable F420-dependent enzyme
MLALVEASSLQGLPDWARLMLNEARVARLGLIDDLGRPRVLPVTFTAFEERLYSAIDQKPKRVAGADVARVRYLRRRPEATLTVDHYDDDWSALAWVQALCRAQIVEPDARPAALDALKAKYRPYRLSPPHGPLIELIPERILYWTAAPPAQ